MSQTSDLIESFRRTSSTASDIINEFKRPILQNKFFLNKSYLIKNSKKIKFDVPKWHLRPEQFAQDYYNDSNFFHIILLVNDISTRFNFKQTKFPFGIITPSEYSINQVLSQVI